MTATFGIPILAALSDRAEQVAGATLFALALALIVAEFFAPTHGSVAAGGLVILVVGLIVLADSTESAVPSLLLVALGVLLALFAALVIVEIVLARHRPVTTGAFGLENEIGTVREAMAPEGTVFIHGERWRAVSADGTNLPIGTPVRVLAVRELTLIVQPLTAGETGLPPTPGTYEEITFPGRVS
jgi:membrane-bound serine protease (ClpP class)